jgi:uncharacterized cupin superfamily protein
MTQAPGPIRIDPDQLDFLALELDPAGFQSPLPVQHYALVFEDEGIGLAVGIWDTTTMQEAFGPYPGDEYITVLDGCFLMVDAADAPLAAAGVGDSVTFRNGAPASWKQEGYLRKVYLTLQNPDGTTPKIASAEGAFQVLDEGRLPQGRPDPDGVTREVVFRNDAATMTVTLCSFPACKLPAEPRLSHCLIRVLSGAITLIDAATPPDRYAAGSHVFLPRGTDCTWEVAAGTIAVMVDVAGL